MNNILARFLSMSFSGALLILILIIFRPLYQNRTGRRWQYYIWLIVIASLLLPFSVQKSISILLMEWTGIWQIVSEDVTELEDFSDGTALQNISTDSDGNRLDKNHFNENHLDEDDSNENRLDEDYSNENHLNGNYLDEKHLDENHLDENYLNGKHLDENRLNLSVDAAYDKNADSNWSGVLSEIITYVCRFSHLWVVWLGTAVVFFVRKITVYQEFIVYMKAGWEEVADMQLLDTLAQVGERVGVKRPVELYTNSLICSPLLIGFFHPCIVLPSAQLSEADFKYTIWHEMVHLKHMDMLYKWLVQLTLCLHWFNPLVWLMSRELGRACELACDEAVICRLDKKGQHDYGDTLLNALKTGDGFKHPLPSVTLSADAKQLKERLYVIMNYKKSSRITFVLSVVLTASLAAAAVEVGAAVPAEPAAADAARAVSGDAGKKGSAAVSVSGDAGKKGSTAVSTSDSSAEKYYKAGNLPAFGKEFSKMDKDEQKEWLERIYEDDEIAFFNISLTQLEEADDFVKLFAKKAYKDEKINFFFTLAQYMDRKMKMNWLAEAERDKRTAYQMGLLEELGMKAELEKKRTAEYNKYGITLKGSFYYYKGKRVRLLLDSQENSSAYFTSMDPEGTVNVRIKRDADGKIISVKRMSNAKAEKLMVPSDKEKTKKEQTEQGNIVDKAITQAGGEKVTVPVQINRVKDGEFVWLGTYELDKNDKIYYSVSAKDGERLDIGFADTGIEEPDVTYCTVSNYCVDGKLQVKAGFTWKRKSGKYRLFIHTREGDLKKVSGAAVIVRADS